MKKKTVPKMIVKVEPDAVPVSSTVYRQALSLQGASSLKAGDLIKHVRLFKIISIKRNDDNSADCEVEVVKRYYEKTYV